MIGRSAGSMTSSYRQMTAGGRAKSRTQREAAGRPRSITDMTEAITSENNDNDK